MKLNISTGFVQTLFRKDEASQAILPLYLLLQLLQIAFLYRLLADLMSSGVIPIGNHFYITGPNRLIFQIVFIVSNFVYLGLTWLDD